MDGEGAAARKRTAVYATGLPEDTTVDELAEYFGKYGVIMDDMFTGRPRIKLYEREDGAFKGEALVVYLREESATLAAQLLDESYFRPTVLIRVEPARFEREAATEEAPPSSSPAVPEGARRKVDKRTWKQHMQQMQRKLEWTANDALSPEEEAALNAERRRREKYARIVVLRGMFAAGDLADDPKFVLELKEEVREEAERLGEVSAVHVLADKLLCTIKFRERESAEACLRLMNGRYFGGRRIAAYSYDGSFSLREQSTRAEAEEQERLERFGEWLEGQEADDKQDDDGEGEKETETPQAPKQPRLDDGDTAAG